MISFTNVSKQYGRQVLFVEASFQLHPGQKAGLVGPNGAGKTTAFRMIVGEEAPDEGEVSVPRRLSIGYYRQDTGEMAGRSVLDETIASSGTLGDLHHELKDLETAMADPERAADLDRILERFGHVQEEYERGGGYDLESRAREILHGLPCWRRLPSAARASAPALTPATGRVPDSRRSPLCVSSRGASSNCTSRTSTASRKARSTYRSVPAVPMCVPCLLN